MLGHHAECHILVLGPSLGRLLASAVAWLEQSSHLPRLVWTFLGPGSTLAHKHFFLTLIPLLNHPTCSLLHNIVIEDIHLDLLGHESAPNALPV